MQPREDNQRPISRNSYDSYRPPSADSPAGVPERQPETVPQPPQPVSPAPPQQPAFQPNPATPPSPPQAPPKPVWDTAAVEPLVPTRPQEQPQIQAEQPPALQVPQPEEQPQLPPQSQPLPAPKVLNFEAPSKQKTKKKIPNPLKKIPIKKIPLKKTFKVLGGVAGAALIGGAIFYFLAPFIITASPATLLKDGLTNDTKLRQVQVDIQNGHNTGENIVDVTNLKAPVVSSKFTLIHAGASFAVSTYGTNSNTFFSYSGLPSGVNQQLTNQVANKWVQIRKNNKVDASASHFIAGLADPRTQILGPIIYGNFDSKSSNQLVNFLITNNVYKLQSQKTTKSSVDGQRAVVLPITIDTGYLKVAMQSAALSFGYSPNDIADVVRSMDFYKGAKGDLYISPRGHKILELALTATDGTQITLDYSNFNKVSPAPEPSSSINWSSFAQTEWLIESQSYSKVAPANLDIVRKAAIDSLHTNLASYAAQKGYYPTLASMNDLSWLTNIALGAPEMQKDPLSTNLNMAPAPAAHTYSYIPSPANCNDTTVACAHYSLTSTLSNAQQYTVQDP